MDIRALESSRDSVAFQSLRLQALETNPEAFGESFRDARQRNTAFFADQISDHGKGDFVLGAFEGSKLVGMAGFYREQQEKLSHKGVIWGVYVTPACRSRGIARVLLTQIISITKGLSGLAHLKLTVVTTNMAAFALYTELGFKSYGTEENALLIMGESFDEHLMQLAL